MQVNPAKKIRLYDLSSDELVDFAVSIGEKPYRGHQLASWLFRKGADDLEQMTDISRKVRSKISETATSQSLLKPISVDLSPDGSIRILWELSDDEKVESVVLPERDHLTLCLSTQVGCRMGCRFCRTGTLGLTRNLSPGEILGQIVEAKKIITHPLPLTNLVFMGMGEPLENAENTLKSIAVITDPALMAFSMRRISVSTVGVIPELKRLSSSGGISVGLTISLGSATDEIRSSIMPVNKAWPIAELKQVLLNFPLQRGRRLTFAYVLLKDVNDSPQQAQALSRFLGGLKAKVNLIPFNPWPQAPFQSPSQDAVDAFKKVLTDKHHTVIVRRSKGQSIGAACGQLAAEITKKDSD
ncbi:MAG: 23S rRNA (adenine(2503)-C(2))-methyltransferase RlmN [Deltaproteobacteria bacterium]|nr:23S rRNA (adenine(2503)-C(2))-methyltransferase RlmN [Deltaproteobacteria bacterium]